MDWRWPAVITATLFLNFSFCNDHGLRLSGFGPFPVDQIVSALGAGLIAALFFLGPALAAQASQVSVFQLLRESLGTVPAALVRAGCFGFFSIWAGKLIALPTLWAVAQATGNHDSPGSYGVAAALVAFLLVTAMQRHVTFVRLALFTAKLSLAILIAAAVRVRDGWPAVPGGFSIAGQYPWGMLFMHDISEIALFAAPLGLCAAEYASRLPSSRQVFRAIAAGTVLPLVAALTLSSMVGVATRASDLYQPSLNPTLAMALWAHAASSAIPPRMLIAGVTNFGAARFALREIHRSVPEVVRLKAGWLAPVVIAAIIAGVAFYPFNRVTVDVSHFCGKCLAIAGAVVTVDFWLGLRAADSHKFDLAGTTALLSGMAMSVWLPENYLWTDGQWWLPWLLPAYGITAITCVAGRLAQRHLGTRTR